MTVDVIDDVAGAVKRVPLEFGPLTNACQICLALAPGASSVQVVAREGDEVVAWIEVPAQPGEQVMVEFRRDRNGEVRAFSHNKAFLILPDEEPPHPALIKPSAAEELDLVVLVDGTCLHPATEAAGGLSYLLAPELAGVWKGLVNGISQFATQAAMHHPKLWATAIAFGDEPMAMLANVFLKPTYLLHPPSVHARKLQSLSPGQLADILCTLPPTPGGDFVDGLADGLQACLDVSWRQNSRKLLLVFGQSPGYSVLEATDDMTDFLIRKACVEEEQAALHEKGVEIVTVFHQPPDAEDRYSNRLPGVLQRAREQYRKLASLREWSCLSGGKEFAELASQWIDPPSLIARGPSPGLIATNS